MPPVRGFRLPTMPRVNWHGGTDASTNGVIDTETARQARIARDAPRVPWEKFRRTLDWRSGEHFTLIGPTNSGKTTMLENLLQLHPYVAIIATKPRDESMDRFITEYGYVRMDRWRRINPLDVPRRIVWPDIKSMNKEARKKLSVVVGDALEKIYIEGGWTVALDELWVIVNLLGLETEVIMYLTQARSLGISLIAGTQRPAHIPLVFYDQSTHLMFWRDNDETNLRRISGISYRSSDLIRNLVSNLEPHQVLYINTRTGEMCRTRAPAPS